MNSKIKKIIIGSAQFTNNYGVSNTFGVTGKEEVKNIIALANENGIKTVDTAIGYGNSQEALGNAEINDWNIITKVPPLSERSKADIHIKNLISDTLDILKINKLNCILLHRPLDLLGSDGKLIYQTLLDLKNEKITDKIGFSIYNPSELSLLLENFKPDIVQIPYNIFDNRFESTGWLSRLKKDNIKVHVRSVFLQGLLLMHRNDRPKYFDRWNQHFKKYDQFLSDKRLTPLEACLSYVFQNKDIDKIIIGVNSKNQLKELIEYCFLDMVRIKDEFVNLDTELINPSLWKI